MTEFVYITTKPCKHETQSITHEKNGWMMISQYCKKCLSLFDEKEVVKVEDEPKTQKTYSGTVEKDSARYVITYLLTDTEYASFMSLGLIPDNTSEVLGHAVVPDDVVEAVSAMGMSERERIEKAGGATC
jgi:hypothetical protein